VIVFDTEGPIHYRSQWEDGVRVADEQHVTIIRPVQRGEPTANQVITVRPWYTIDLGSHGFVLRGEALIHGSDLESIPGRALGGHELLQAFQGKRAQIK
jgi:hypothetical protein